jgi:zeaxanthin glucosyltransferase
MKLGFICLNLPGHLNPMTTLARRLQERNHDVVFLYSSSAAGLPFVSGPEKDQINGSMPDLSKMQGEDALKFGTGVVLAQTETILKSLPDVVQANGLDALVIDTVQLYAELGAMQLEMPYIHVSNALHLDFSGYTPICYYDWPHQTSTSALARNREGVAKRAKMLENANAGIRAYAKSAGLDVDWDNPSATISKLAWITQCPREFDFEN